MPTSGRSEYKISCVFGAISGSLQNYNNLRPKGLMYSRYNTWTDEVTKHSEGNLDHLRTIYEEYIHNYITTYSNR